MSQLVITKALSKAGEAITQPSIAGVHANMDVRLEYAGKQAHVELAERMKQRDAGVCGPDRRQLEITIVQLAIPLPQGRRQVWETALHTSLSRGLKASPPCASGRISLAYSFSRSNCFAFFFWLQGLPHMRNPKIRCMCWSIVFLSTPSTIWTINYRNRFCGYLTLSWANIMLNSSVSSFSRHCTVICPRLSFTTCFA